MKLRMYLLTQIFCLELYLMIDEHGQSAACVVLIRASFIYEVSPISKTV